MTELINTDGAIEALKVQISSSASELTEQARKVEVWDEKSATDATDLAVIMKAYLKRAEDERVKITQPINEGLRLINQRFREMCAPLQKAFDDLSLQIKKFQLAEFERKRKADEEAAEKARAELAALAPPAVSLEDFPAILPPVSAPKKSEAARGNFGSSFVAEKWVHELVDIELVPKQYTLTIVNDAAVKVALKAGVRSIPGLNIKNEGDIKFRK